MIGEPLNKKVSALIDKIIFVGTGVVALSGLVFYFGEYSRADSQRQKRMTLEHAALLEVADSKQRIDEVMARLPTQTTLRVGPLIVRTKLGGLVHAMVELGNSDIAAVALDYPSLEGREELAFTDGDGHRLTAIVRQGGVYVLPARQGAPKALRVSVGATFLEFIDLDANLSPTTLTIQ